MGNIIEQLTDDEFLYLQPWFYNNELALRCELGIGEDDYMENAFSRAMQIANVLFANRKIDAAFFINILIPMAPCRSLEILH